MAMAAYALRCKAQPSCVIAASSLQLVEPRYMLACFMPAWEDAQLGLLPVRATNVGIAHSIPTRSGLWHDAQENTVDALRDLIRRDNDEATGPLQKLAYVEWDVHVSCAMKVMCHQVLMTAVPPPRWSAG